MPDKDAEIIEFNPHRDEAPVRTRGFRRSCTHSFMVDEENETVTCTRCNRPFTPFDAMVYLANHWRGLWSEIKYARRDLKALEQRIDELKREERNAKARLRRAQRNLPLPK